MKPSNKGHGGLAPGAAATSPGGEPIDRVLDRLEGVQDNGPGRWTARCPCPGHTHDDKNPSLTVAVTSDGTVLVKCHAGHGHTAADVAEAIGLEMRDLFRGNGGGKVSKVRDQIIATFDYLDADRNLRHQTVRHDTADVKKRFSQRRPDHDHPGRWIYNLRGVTPILYRIPDLIDADPDAIVFVVEGEKHADKLWSLGLVATTCPMGAGKWAKVDASPTDGRSIVILPDNDGPGRKHAQTVAAERYGKSASVKVIELPGLEKAGDDIIEWLDGGGTVEDLLDLADHAAEWQPKPVTAEVPSGDGHARSPFNLNDDGNALRFAERYQGDLRYVRKQKQWFRWVGDRWAEDQVGAVIEMAREVSRRIADEAAGQSELRRGLILKWAGQSHNVARVHAMVELAGSDARLALAPEQMNADPWLLNCPNGTVDLRTGLLRPHDPADLITKMCGAPFVPGARHDLWDRFLRDATGGYGSDGDQDLIDFLQRFAGYSIVGDTREEVLAFVHGPTAAGKSTLAAAFAAALGDYLVTAAFDTFLEHRGGGGGGARGDIARLHGARIVNAVEVDEGKKFDSGVVKRMTGRDTVTARFNYKDDFEYVPQFTLWLYANHVPHIKPADDGMWNRRVKIIPFVHTVPPDDIDTTLKTTLTDDPGARTAGLAWMVEGCLKWQRDGLQVPKVVTDATKEKRREADLFAALSGDCLDFSRKFAWTSNADIRRAADAWAKEQGLKYTIPQKKLTDKLTAGGAQVGKCGGDRGWYGVAIVAGFEVKEETS